LTPMRSKASTYISMPHRTPDKTATPANRRALRPHGRRLACAQHAWWAKVP